jgi:23S rRNA (cytidine1920-2'-O)/16S rRNA (cytidine1409-2'-O)-methyltransferase
LRERTNIRYLTPEELYAPEQPRPDLGVVDLSFISLTKVLPALWNLLASPKELVLLVKPQFEVGRGKVGKKGVVRDSNDQAAAILQVWEMAQTLGWQFNGLTWSPLLGPAGNIEYLLWLEARSGEEPGEESGETSLDLATARNLTQTAQQILTRGGQSLETTNG